MTDRSVPALRADPSRVRHLSLAIQLEEGGQPKLMRVAVWLVLALLGEAVAWASVTEVAQVARAPSEVVPAGSVIAVQHLEGGIVRKLAAREGELVEEGQTIMEIDRTAATAELDQLRARESALRLQAERLRAFADGRAARLESRDEQGLSQDQAAILRSQEAARTTQRAVLERQVAGRRQDLAALEAQRETMQRQARITGEALDMRQRLFDQGLNSRLSLLDIQREQTRVQGEISTVQVNIVRAREAVTEAEQRLVELDARLANESMREFGTVTTELRQIEEARVRLEDRVARTTVTAPVRGLIKDMRVRSEGAVATPGQTLLEIVPVGRELEIEARIQPSDIGQIRLGQAVSVKVSTFDYARFGSVQGEVRQISATTFVDQQGRPYYRAIVTLASDHVGDDPTRNKLAPGMTVLADIKTDERTILRYLLNPIYRSLDSAFHEK
jgi:HlyD family secretion protein/adhesin transport system membrane fusion protein